MTRNECLAQVAWKDTAIATALVVAVGNVPGLLDVKGLWAPALLGPPGLALLLVRPDDLSDSRFERVGALAFVGALYGLVTAAPVCWGVALVAGLVADVDLPWLVVANIGGIGPLIAPAVYYLRMPAGGP